MNKIKLSKKAALQKNAIGPILAGIGRSLPLILSGVSAISDVKNMFGKKQQPQQQTQNLM